VWVVASLEAKGRKQVFLPSHSRGSLAARVEEANKATAVRRKIYFIGYVDMLWLCGVLWIEIEVLWLGGAKAGGRWYRRWNDGWGVGEILYICPGLTTGSEVTEIFRQTNDSTIVKIYENEGVLHVGVCSGCPYWPRCGGRNIGGLTS
jgi:hypothetical protein